MTVATVKATVQFFPLRQGDKTHPEVRKMFVETHENSNRLKHWTKIAKSLNNQGKIKGKESGTNHEHYRLVSGVIADRHLEQICRIDNESTGTQGAIWCDTTHKQVPRTGNYSSFIGY